MQEVHILYECVFPWTEHCYLIPAMSCHVRQRVKDMVEKFAENARLQQHVKCFPKNTSPNAPTPTQTHTHTHIIWDILWESSSVLNLFAANKNNDHSGATFPLNRNNFPNKPRHLFHLLKQIFHSHVLKCYFYITVIAQMFTISMILHHIYLCLSHWLAFLNRLSSQCLLVLVG